MKYLGYVLYLFVYFAAFFTEAGSKFFKDSLELAPEITILVSIFYNYNVFLTFLLTLFPNVVPAKNRANFYNVHIKMSCSVMVSLGLVGTFLGLVDMISGIGAALSGEETDFAKRMATLLAAISTSLGAMAFAFMTSILGVGLSAYSIVAATFVGSALVAIKKETEQEEKERANAIATQAELDKIEQEKIQAEEEARQRAAEMIPLVKNIIENTFIPIAQRLEGMEERQTKLLEQLTTNDPFKQRFEEIENKIANLDFSSIEKQLTPLVLIDALKDQQAVFATHNAQIAEGIQNLSNQHASLIEEISRASVAVENHTQLSHNQIEVLESLQHKIKENTNSLTELDNSLINAGSKVKIISSKLKSLFE